jgi:hypothetical protein
MQRFAVIPLIRGTFGIYDVIPEAVKHTLTDFWMSFEKDGKFEWLNKGRYAGTFEFHTKDGLAPMIGETIVIGLPKKDQRWYFKVEDFDDRFIVLSKKELK